MNTPHEFETSARYASLLNFSSVMKTSSRTVTEKASFENAFLLIRSASMSSPSNVKLIITL